MNKCHCYVFVFLLALVFIAYYPCIDNYFTFDDFFWLQRAVSLTSNPSQMFNVDVIYFDPLVYVTFWLNFKLAALNTSWYHVLDLLLHFGNTVLVYIFVSRISKDSVAAVVSASIFAITFSTVDAVVWSSSRCDTHSFFFCLASIILFSEFLDRGGKRFLVFSLVLYVFALGSKGTPSVLPLILSIMILSKKDRKSGVFYLLLPHVFITGLFFTLLAIKIPLFASTNSSSTFKININNFLISFSELFIPERFIYAINYKFFTIIMIGLIALFIFSRKDRTHKRIACIGITILLAGLAPVLVIGDFKLLTSVENKFLLTSPSHRIYLASAGFSILAGVFFSAILAKKRLVSCVSLILYVVLSIFEIRQREQIWDSAAKYNQKLVADISQFKGKIFNDGMLVLINFDLPRGFIRPILDVYCDAKNVLILPMIKLPHQIIDNPDLIRFVNRGQLFVYGKGIHDFSNRFNQLLSISYRHMFTNDSVEKAMLLAEYQQHTKIMNAGIDVITNQH